MAYFSGQGIVYTSDRDTNGNYTVFKDLGNVSELRVAFDTTTVTHKESRTGQRIEDYRLITEKKATVTMTLEDWTAQNLKILMFGTSSTATSASITNETLASGIVVDDLVVSKFPFISSVTVTDSAGSPATLTANTHYQIVDASAGIIKFLNLAAFTQPFKLNYTYATHESVQMYRDPARERYMRFAGLNTANSDKSTVVDLYRFIIDPTKQFDLIVDDLAKFQVEGSVLFDSTRNADSALGGFGRVLGTTTI